MRDIFCLSSLLLLVTIFLLPVHTLAAEPPNGVISGKVENRTGGITEVTHQTITLTTLQNNAVVHTSVTETDNIGNFEFTGLMLDESYKYFVSVDYEEATYRSEELHFENKETRKDITLNVYDSTNGNENIRIAEAYTVVFLDKGVLEIAEYYLFHNDSDRTFIGEGEPTPTGRRKTLELAISPNASIFRVGGELDAHLLHSDADVLFDTAAVVPGEKRLAYFYTVPLQSKSYTIVRNIEYTTMVYRVLVEIDKATAVSDRLSNGGNIVEIGNATFFELSGVNFNRGDVINVILTPISTGIGLPTVILASLVFILAAGAGAYIYIRKKIVLPPAPSENSQELKSILIEIARLDDEAAAGIINRQDYDKLRAAKKTQAVELWRRNMKGSEDDTI